MKRLADAGLAPVYCVGETLEERDGGRTESVLAAQMGALDLFGDSLPPGFGVAFLSMHTCVLELNAGVLSLLPMAGNPIERDWYVMHIASHQLPQVALAFEKFLCTRGQQEIARQLGEAPGSGALSAARARASRRAPARKARA